MLTQHRGWVRLIVSLAPWLALAGDLPPRISVGIVIQPSGTPPPPIIYHQPDLVCDYKED